MLAACSASFAREISLPIFWLWKTETRDKRLDGSGLCVKFLMFQGLKKTWIRAFTSGKKLSDLACPWHFLLVLVYCFYGKLRQTANVNLFHVAKFFIYLSFTVHYSYAKIGRFTPILSVRIVSSYFYLHITHFKNFSTWISRLPFAVNAMLNFSNDLVTGWLA